MSPQRIERIEQTENDVFLSIKGAHNELIDFTVMVNDEKYTISCKLGKSLKAVISVRQRICLC